MHVAEQVQRKAFGWGMDLVGEVAPGASGKPVNRVVGQEQTGVVLLDPVGTRTAAGAVKLPDIQVQFLPEIAARQLEVGAVEAQDTKSEVSGVDGR